MRLARTEVDVASDGSRLSSNPVKPRRFRGSASRRRNNILPTRKRARDTDNDQSSSEHSQQGRQQDFPGELETGNDEVYIYQFKVAHHVQFAVARPDSPARSLAHLSAHSSPARSPDFPDVPLRPPNPPPGSATRQPTPPPQHQFGINYQRRVRPNVDLDALSRSANFQPMRDTIDFIPHNVVLWYRSIRTAEVDK
ncbi:hypothetical protein BS17DRAFT_785708 [Gyrodon lividus]|nr:hypothetical protein BS17DRAFT_785708 [Gyrodon lividus]